ncbi:uncharacterized protein EMH_0013490 [Eimeria mitis]|uniref:Uncharacterized protein n=1 Tax=Eimeria mitis TaxID=44415 RepID=U6K4R7_9EIME|nr:uncharacterized protein EMH_0013490 [Eimeria mitis]CDJ32730.1 hypothetical protein EMH_0013490 [Eimeria mitis]
MKSKKQSFKLPGLRRRFLCLWMFVVLWIVEQQNVYSSRASGRNAAEDDAELETTGGVPDDTMARLHDELAAQQEMVDPQLASLHLTENRCHVIAFTVLFLILVRAVVLLRGRERKKKAEEEVKPPKEKPQPEGEERKEAEEGKPVQEEEPSPEQLVSQPEEPAKEIPLPQMPTPEMPVPIPPRKPKAEVPHEKQPEEPGGDGIPDEEFVQRPITRTRRTGKQFVRRAGPPTTAPPQVQPGIEEEEEAAAEEHAQQGTQPPPVGPTTPQPTLPQLPEQAAPGPAPGLPEDEYMEPSVLPAVVTLPPHEAQEPTPVADIHEDKELQELRARRNVISNLVNVANMLVNELPGNEARSILDVLKENVDTAEKAEREYNVAKGRMDPNLPLIRSEAVIKMGASIGGARDALVELVSLAKFHGQQVYEYCSEKIFFSDAVGLQTALDNMMDSNAFKISLLTLGRVASASITLIHENEDRLRILQSLEFVDECGANDFVKAYAAVAAMNYRMKTLERLSAMDGALNRYILQAHKAWLMGKLQFVRVPREMDANLIQEIHVLLSKVRPASAGQTSSGITNEEMQAVKDLFQWQYKDVQGMEAAEDVEAATYAYQRANQVNQRLKSILQAQKERLNSALKRQTLNKEEANAAAEAIAKIAETVVGDIEDVPEVEYMEPSVPPAVVTLPPHEEQEPTPVADIHEDKELQELRARRNVINNLVNVATMLVNELPGNKARSILDVLKENVDTAEKAEGEYNVAKGRIVLKENVDTAEKAEGEYNVAKGRMDPNLPLIRSEAVSKMGASIGGARDALVELVSLAKSHGQQVYEYCSEKIIFSDAERLQTALENMMDSNAFKISLLTLARVASASITLIHENEDQLRILQSLEFVDECGANDFVKAYAAVAAMNYRMKNLQRLSAMDSELNRYILQAHKGWLMGSECGANDFVKAYAAVAAMNYRMKNLQRLSAMDRALNRYILQAHKAWLTGKLQFVRIPREMDANLIQEIHVLLSKVRLAPAGQTASGITNEEMQVVKDLFQRQHKDVQGMDAAKDVEAATEAYKRANQVNQSLKSILQAQKEKLTSALKLHTLSKEEANAAAGAIAQIAESVVGDIEGFWRVAHDVYAQIGCKPEDIVFGTGKALLQKLKTKIMSSTGEQVEGAVAAENVAADAVKKWFFEQWRRIEGWRLRRKQR